MGGHRGIVGGIAALGLVVTLSLSPAVAGVHIAAPREGAVVDTAQILLAGREDGVKSGSVEVSLNGSPLPAVAVQDGIFIVPLTLQEGKNTVSLRTPSGSRKISYEYRPGGKDSYRFHPGYLDEGCGECHPKGPGLTAGGTQSDLCHGCHDKKDGHRYLHGPVGAGQCSFCHDPHGSSEKAFLTAAGNGICTACHDQPGSTGHMEKSRTRECVECHDPHGSGKKFFLY